MTTDQTFAILLLAACLIALGVGIIRSVLRDAAYVKAVSIITETPAAKVERVGIPHQTVSYIDEAFIWTPEKQASWDAHVNLSLDHVERLAENVVPLRTGYIVPAQRRPGRDS